MAIIFLVLTAALLIMYLKKIILNYKLLRIREEGSLNKNEDYLLTWFTSNKYFLIKVKSGTLSPIKEDYSDPTSNSLKEKINKLLKIIKWTIIIYLVMILASIF